MTNTYANTVDEDFEESWIKLAAAAGNVLAFLQQRRETGSGADSSPNAPEPVDESAEGQPADGE